MTLAVYLMFYEILIVWNFNEISRTKLLNWFKEFLICKSNINSYQDDLGIHFSRSDLFYVSSHHFPKKRRRIVPGNWLFFCLAWELWKLPLFCKLADVFHKNRAGKMILKVGATILGRWRKDFNPFVANVLVMEKPGTALDLHYWNMWKETCGRVIF